MTILWVIAIWGMFLITAWLGFVAYLRLWYFRNRSKGELGLFAGERREEPYMDEREAMREYIALQRRASRRQYGKESTV